MSCVALELLLYNTEGIRLDEDGCLSLRAVALLSKSLVRVLQLKLDLKLLKAWAFWVIIK